MFYNCKGGFNCSRLPAGLGGNKEFERKIEEILGILREKIQNGVSLGGSPAIKVILASLLK